MKNLLNDPLMTKNAENTSGKRCVFEVKKISLSQKLCDSIHPSPNHFIGNIFNIMDDPLKELSQESDFTS